MSTITWYDRCTVGVGSKMMVPLCPGQVVEVERPGAVHSDASNRPSQSGLKGQSRYDCNSLCTRGNHLERH